MNTLFEAVDTSESGYIEYTEFIVASTNEIDLLKQMRLDAAFKMFDTDQSGFISKQEMRNVFAPTHCDRTIELIFKQADLDGDGQISYSEFIQMMKTVC